MNRFLLILVIVLIYLLTLTFLKPQIFSYKFDPSLIDRYFCSQDIPTEPPCKRLFLSDGDIHIAAGYLYITGADPTKIHFQHPPFIKYLYGLTIILTQNPYYLEILFGILYLCLTYILALKLFRSLIIAGLATLLLSFDPLFIFLSADISLELAQACLLLAYLLAVLYKKNNFLLQGIFLGLSASSKFWGAALFFVLVLNGFSFIKKKFKPKIFLLHLLVGFIVFCLTYLKTFINKGGLFNIFFFQLKMLNYWRHHSVTNVPFSSLSLFLGGFYKSWWGNQLMVRVDTWLFLWPIMFLTSLVNVVKFLKRKVINNEFLINLIPIIYLLYLGIQAPFPRYFILILPFFYITFVKWVVNLKLIKKISIFNYLKVQ